MHKVQVGPYCSSSRSSNRKLVRGIKDSPMQKKNIRFWLLAYNVEHNSRSSVLKREFQNWVRIRFKTDASNYALERQYL